MASGDTKTEHYLDVAANGSRADLPTDSCCETRSQTLIRGVAERIMDVEEEVERLENNPDVADIVATYADLQSYDTSKLTDNAVIRVLADETHNDDSTYYRYSLSTGEFTYIGESKQYTDFVGTDGTAAGEAGLVPAPAVADAGKFLKADGTWGTVNASSITPLTTADFNANYNDWNDTNPANFNCIALWKLEDGIYEPQTESSTQDYRLYSTTTNYSDTTSIGGTRQELFIVLRMIPSLYPNTIINIDHNGVISYRTITVASSGATATTNRVSSAVPRSEIYYTDSTGTPTESRIAIRGTTTGSQSVSIGNSSSASGYSAALGSYAKATGSVGSTAVGIYATASSDESTAVGRNTTASADGSVALGSYARATVKGQFDVSTGSKATYGYNNSNYRLLTGLYDGQSAHDAATVGQINATIDAINTALNVSIPHIGANS